MVVQRVMWLSCKARVKAEREDIGVVNSMPDSSSFGYSSWLESQNRREDWPGETRPGTGGVMGAQSRRKNSAPIFHLSHLCYKSPFPASGRGKKVVHSPETQTKISVLGIFRAWQNRKRVSKLVSSLSFKETSFYALADLPVTFSFVTQRKKVSQWIICQSQSKDLLRRQSNCATPR